MIECQTTGICNKVEVSETPETYYLDAKTKSVISCSSVCIFEDKTLNGYFINSGYKASTNKVIQCIAGRTDPSLCNLVTNVVSCSTIGCVKVDDINNPTSVFLCLTSECNSPDNTEIISSTTKGHNVPLTLSQDNDFPGGKSGQILVKVRNEHSVIIIKGMRYKHFY